MPATPNNGGRRRREPEALRLARAALIPTEHEEQVAFLRRVELIPRGVRPLVFAIPNGGERHYAVAVKLRTEGVLAGVPDLFVAAPRNEWGGLFIEMKRRKGGTLTQAQREMLHTLARAGYAVTVAAGHDQAYEALRRYLGASWTILDQSFDYRPEKSAPRP